MRLVLQQIQGGQQILIARDLTIERCSVCEEHQNSRAVRFRFRSHAKALRREEVGGHYSGVRTKPWRASRLCASYFDSVDHLCINLLASLNLLEVTHLVTGNDTFAFTPQSSV